MLNKRLFGILLFLVFFLNACGPAVIVPPDAQPLPSPSGPQPLPSPSGSWDLSLNQSGGLAGVDLRLEVSSDGRLSAEDNRSGKKVTQQLDAATLEKLSRLVSSVSTPAAQPPRSNCADCFLYDLQIHSDGGSLHFQADDITLAASGAQELIALLQQLRNSALKS